LGAIRKCIKTLTCEAPSAVLQAPALPGLAVAKHLLSGGISSRAWKWPELSSYPRRSSRPLVCEDVVPVVRDRVAGAAVLSVAGLRRLVTQCGGRERIGCGVVFELGMPPPAAVGQPLGVFQHEINIVLSIRHRRLTVLRLILRRVPMRSLLRTR